MERIDQVGRRAGERFALRMAVSLRFDGVPVNGSLIDLSTHGARLQTPKRLATGAAFHLALGSLGPRRCIVIWAQDMFVGVRFAEPLHASVVEHLCARHAALSHQDLVDLRSITIRCEMLGARAYGPEQVGLDDLAAACRAALERSETAAAA